MIHIFKGGLSPPTLPPRLHLAVRALCRCLFPGGLCTVPLAGLQQTLFCQPPNSLHHSQPGHRGLWEAAPKTGSPWGQVESFLVQVPLNIPVRNHLQTFRARQGTDCSQRPFKLWFPHPMGLCWHDATPPPGHPGCPGLFETTLCKAARRAPALGTCRNVSSTSPQPQ